MEPDLISVYPICLQLITKISTFCDRDNYVITAGAIQQKSMGISKKSVKGVLIGIIYVITDYSPRYKHVIKHA